MPALSDFEAMVLMASAYFQPIPPGDLSKIFGKEVSRDTIASLRNAGFLTAFGMQTLRDLPDIEALEDAGLLSRQADLSAASTAEQDDNEV